METAISAHEPGATHRDLGIFWCSGPKKLSQSFKRYVWEIGARGLKNKGLDYTSRSFSGGILGLLGGTLASLPDQRYGVDGEGTRV